MTGRSSGTLPALNRALLLLVLPDGLNRDALLGDLSEEFKTRARNGPMRARFWLWRVTAQIAVAFVLDSILTIPGALLQDLRFAVRSFARSPAFTFFAVATLAVGVGATTSVFGVADALLLRPLPLHEPDRLVAVYATEPALNEWNNVMAGPTYLAWRDGVQSFQGMAGYRTMSYNLVGDGFPERIQGASVTLDFFEVLGIQAALGRTPTAVDAGQGGRVVVLTDALWRSRFGGAAGIVGRSLDLSGISIPVVGVLPPGFSFPPEIQLFVSTPYRVPERPNGADDMSEEAGAQYMSAVARLAPGATLERAQAELDAVSAELERTYPEANYREGGLAVPLQRDMVGDTRAVLMVLLGAVGFVMLIACANVANLLTVRASRRSRELSVRMALGAGISRVRRQLLTESLLLAILGAVPGFLLAVVGTRALVALAPDSIPRLGEITVDSRVFLFSVALALATGLLFGLAPAVGLSSRGTGLAGGLHGDRTLEGRRSRLRDTVVVVEVALSLLLLIGAGLMVRTFQGLLSTDPGFDASSTLVAHVSLPISEYDEDPEITAFFQDALREIRSIPGVQSAGTVMTLPMHWAIRGTFGMSIAGREAENPGEIYADYQTVSPGYFSTLRIPVVTGRGIEEADGPDAEMVAVINEALRDRYWGDSDPLGARITFWGDPEDPETPWARVVGVVANTAVDGLDGAPSGEAYMPQRQNPMTRSTFVVRTAADPYASVPALREAIARVDPRLPLYGVSSMDDVVAESLGARRFQMLLMTIFAATALIMAVVGLYGVLSFSVAQRVREIGVRKALGAPAAEVVLDVVRRGYSRVLLGLVLGLLGSVAMSHIIESQLHGIEAIDVWSYTAATVILGSVALLACWVPATRAAHVDPLEAIRAE